MKLATLGLATALVFTGSFALAQSGGGSAGGGSAAGGAAATGTTDPQRNDNRQCDGCAEQRHVKRRRQCRGRTGQWANPSGSTQINPSPSGSTLTPAAPGRTGR